MKLLNFFLVMFVNSKYIFTFANPKNGECLLNDNSVICQQFHN